MRTILLIAYTVILTSCSPSAEISSKKQLIFDRTGHPTYWAAIPEEWKRQDPLAGEASQDTTKALCTLIPGDNIHLTIHNFPQEQRIPPVAQIARWKQQLPEGSVTFTTPVAWGGYQGLCLEGPTVLGWALALAPYHLNHVKDPQKRADVTIKAMGSAEAIETHKEAIIAFARSFELVEEIQHQ